jgi:hypothetical protein
MSYELSEDERDAIREEAKRDAYERTFGCWPTCRSRRKATLIACSGVHDDANHCTTHTTTPGHWRQ